LKFLNIHSILSLHNHLASRLLIEFYGTMVLHTPGLAPPGATLKLDM